MTLPADESLLDDPDRLAAADPGQMLRMVASSAAQVREAALRAEEAGLDQLRDEGRPRAVLVLGVGGGAGVAGTLLSGVAGPQCPVPIVTHRTFGLPGWSGVADLVFAVSSTGATPETLTGADEAVRRGCRVVAVTEGDGPLADLVQRGRGIVVPVEPGRPSRANLWALSIPLVLAARELNLLSLPPDAIEASAAALEAISISCRPSSESFVNEGKDLALQLAGSLPLLWGSTVLTGAAAYRLGFQLAENAKYPALLGGLPDFGNYQAVAWDGPFGAGAASGSDPTDFFRDRLADEARIALRLVLLRDAEGEAAQPRLAVRADALAQLARERGLQVTEIKATGSSPLERLASLIGLADYASVYLAIATGVDPMTLPALSDLDERLDEPGE
ncbi:MAG: SIS domain-containing protein [Frankiaceae bacterium]